MKEIIKIYGLSKKYKIAHEKVPYQTLRDTVVDFARHPFKAMGALGISMGIGGIGKKNERETFWALKDVNFSINKGEIVGIIGKNGAGKSTLLKILSGITRPTEGKIDLWGKTSSLLEVGTGFHPELTGRENIFLNGVILGMKQKEVAEKFDQIVAFSGVEKFLDTPVKHYSSGMHVRLAFSVAAHLEPDILIVDEVLAVGDMEFQKKCLGKMEEVSKKGGRTVLFVSHNLNAIRQLCQRCILIDKGKIEKDGPTEEVIDHYVQRMKNTSSEISEIKKSSEWFTMKKISYKNKNGHDPWILDYKEDLHLEILMETEIDLPEFRFGIGINKVNGDRITTVHSNQQRIKRGIYKINSIIQNCFTPGTYELNLGILNRYHLAQFALFQVLDSEPKSKNGNVDESRHEDINFGTVDLNAKFIVEKI